jgi:hypothetical protein
MRIHIVLFAGLVVYFAGAAEAAGEERMPGTSTPASISSPYHQTPGPGCVSASPSYYSPYHPTPATGITFGSLGGISPYHQTPAPGMVTPFCPTPGGFSPYHPTPSPVSHR